MAGCPSSHQPTRIREETLESGEPLQRKLNFRLCTLYRGGIYRHLYSKPSEKTSEVLRVLLHLIMFKFFLEEIRLLDKGANS